MVLEPNESPRLQSPFENVWFGSLQEVRTVSLAAHFTDEGPGGLSYAYEYDPAYLTEWEAQVKAQTAEKHGTTEQGCASEQKARGEAPANSIEERITNFRQRIADRQAKEGKNYLSFYYIEGDTYEIVE